MRMKIVLALLFCSGIAYASITINNDLVPSDQMITSGTPLNRDVSISDTIGQILGFLVVVLFILWLVIYLILIAQRSSASSTIYRIFVVIRWSTLALLFALSLFMMALSVVSQFGDQKEMTFTFGAAGCVMGALGTLVLMLKPRSRDHAGI